jgi:hypothetical protein
MYNDTHLDNQGRAGRDYSRISSSQYNSMHGNARGGADAETKDPQLADGNGVQHPAMAVNEPTHYGV